MMRQRFPACRVNTEIVKTARIKQLDVNFNENLEPGYIINQSTFILVLINKERRPSRVLHCDKTHGHLRTRGKCRKHEPQASIFYISSVHKCLECFITV